MSDRAAIWIWIAAGLAAVLASALFSGIETGIYRLNPIRLRLRSESGDRRAGRLARLMRNQRSLLATLLIGNNIANYIGSSAIVAVCALGTTLANWQIALVVPVIVAPVLLVFGEIVPKSIFQAYADRYTYAFVGTITWCRRLFVALGLLPLIDTLTGLLIRVTGRKAAGEAEQLFHPRQQVGRLITESLHQGTLTAYQTRLIDRVMNLRGVRVAQVMVPLSKVRCIRADVTRETFIARAREHNFSRVLVYRDKPANAVGIVSVNEVLQGDPTRPVSDFVQTAPKLRPESPVVHGLFTLQRAHRGLGVVTDKSGAAIGIATLKDLVEEVIGEIEEW